MERNSHSPTNKNLSSNSTLFENSWTLTESKVFKLSHVWRISNYSFFCQEPDAYLSSEKFSLTNLPSDTWMLQLRINPKDNTVVMLLCLEIYQQGYVRAKYRLIVYDNDMREARVVGNFHAFGNDSPRISETICSQSEIFSADKNFLTNDEFTVGCEIECIFTCCMINRNELNCKPEFMDPEPNCFKNLKPIWKNKELSDVEFNIGDTKLRAHKAILAAVSPVFLAMFKSKTAKNKFISINIDDMDKETFEEMLYFIYTGSIEDPEKSAYKLLLAADKYDIDKLKYECEKQVYKKLTVENALELLIFADHRNLNWLKEQIIMFIKNARIKITEARDFELMFQSHHALLTELLQALTL